MKSTDKTLSLRLISLVSSMRSNFVLLFFLMTVCILVEANGQNVSGDKSTVADLDVNGTPAFAEVLLRSTELQAELESLMLDYTDEHPRVKDITYELSVLSKEQKRLLATKAGDIGRLSAALGKMMVLKAEHETQLWKLSENYKDDHPEVRRTKKKVEVYQDAIDRILK